MFRLDQVPAKLTGVNPRGEIHGEKHVPAIDLSVSFDVANDILSQFAPSLRSALFAKPGNAPAPAQGEIDAVPPVSPDLPHLRDLGIDLSPLKLVYEGVGYTTTLHIGIDDASNIVLRDCKVNTLRFTPKEGGTCSFKAVIQHSGVSEAASGRLCTMVGASIVLSLEPPAAGDIK